MTTYYRIGTWDRTSRTYEPIEDATENWFATEEDARASLVDVAADYRDAINDLDDDRTDGPDDGEWFTVYQEEPTDPMQQISYSTRQQLGIEEQS